MAVTEPTLLIENELWAAGYTTVIGCDEVGRGAIAGPVAVGVVALDRGVTTFPAGLRDSKLVSATRRTLLEPLVRSWAPVHAVGYSSALEVDALGIMECLGLAADRAVAGIEASLVDPARTVILLDGQHDWLSSRLTRPLRVITRVKADRDCAVVAAASIIAKVERDAIMTTHDTDHPHYGWASNKGYGSPAHYSAIETTGPSPLHRTTWLKLDTELSA